ncbi:MAG: hypothetical protein AMJ79_01455 [Phycisphaerae bacterium SM23_30]|nr:MAG: hypothetical protein AMJ79_01455 [Phycisphaerae bacterium SM23_30]
MRKLFTLPLSLMSLIFQSAALALGQIWAHKVRSILTTIGIFIGVSAVTTVIASITGLQTKVLSEIETLESSKNINIYPYRPREGPYRYAMMHKIQFEPKDFDGLLEACPSVDTYTFLTQTAHKVRFEERSIDNCSVFGINPSWHNIQNRKIELGRPFSAIDQEQAWQVCLINEEVRDELRLDRDCIGQSIFVGGRSFRIVGVVKAPTLFDIDLEFAEVFIPFETAWKIWKPMMTVLANSSTPELSPQAQAELRFFMRQIRRLNPGEPDTFRLRASEEGVQAFNNIVVVFTAIASCLVGISLLVGGVGIMNIMLVSVSERTREIGLRKAVGAKPSAILLQFLVEAVMLCLLGGLIGIAVGQGFILLITWIVSTAFGVDLGAIFIPLWAVALAFGFSAFVGVVFGFLPAVKAALLDPIEALRHE